MLLATADTGIPPAAEIRAVVRRKQAQQAGHPPLSFCKLQQPASPRWMRWARGALFTDSCAGHASALTLPGATVACLADLLDATPAGRHRPLSKTGRQATFLGRMHDGRCRRQQQQQQMCQHTTTGR